MTDPPAEPATPPAAAQPAKDERKQMNVRLPEDLITEIDDRRSKVRTPSGKGLTRDRWVERALRFALQARPTSQPLRTGPRTRTAPPPQRRTGETRP